MWLSAGCGKVFFRGCGSAGGKTGAASAAGVPRGAADGDIEKKVLVDISMVEKDCMVEKDYRKETDERLDAYREEMVRTLQELVAINSVQAEPKGNMPFGEGVQRAFECVLRKGEEAGFASFNADNYGGHLDFGGTLYDENGQPAGISAQTMGILGHLDVVPLGSDWDHDPLGGEIVDGRIYGRGVSDDKGPVVAALYAMKAIQDVGLMPQKKVRLILGLDEETGWKGMDYYLKKVEAPDFSFTPDGEFPAIHGEMGILVFEIAKKMSKTSASAKGLVLRSLTGGSAPNMVPDGAKMLVRGDSYDELKEKLAEFKKETGFQLTAKGRGKSLEISAEGVSAHGATPWKGQNAISILMQFAGRIGFANEDVCDFIDFYNSCIGFELNGESIGCGFSDEHSGKLIFNVGMAEMDEEAARLTVNIRYPITMDDEQVYGGMMPYINQYDMGIVKEEHRPPIYFEKDHPMIQALMEAYRKYTGDMESEPFVIGGGSYARAVPSAVAFGMLFPGELDTMHQKNESLSIDSMVTAAKIYADAIITLTEAIPVPHKTETEA